METCILCATNFLPSKTKPEHILLNALGGRKTSTRLVCSACNSRMGDGPDKALAESVAAIRAISGFESGDGKSPPALKNVLTCGYSADIRHGKLSPFIRNPLKVEKLGNGLSRIEVKATTIQQLEFFLESGFDQLKVPIEKREALRKQFIESATIEHRPPPPIELKFSMGATEALRSMAKSVLEIWALLIGNTHVLRKEYDKIRAFITRGEASDIVAIDTRPLPEKVTQQFLFPTVLWAGSDDIGNVWGFFSVYGLCGWSFRISTSSQFKNLSCGLVSNPTEPACWLFGPEIGALIDVNWVKARNFHQNDLRASFARLHRHNHERTFSEFVQKCILETMEKTGTQFGDQIQDAFINDLAHRVASAVSKFPWEEPLERITSSTSQSTRATGNP